MPATVATRAERQAITRTELVDAAERLFTGQGFHATTVAAVAGEALHDGMVYSNFASKEDLFFAVYERRAEAVRHVERSIRDLGLATALERLGMDTAARRGRDDGWLAVFLEFWAHVVRPEPARASRRSTRASKPIADAVQRLTGGGEGPMTRRPSPRP